MTQVKTTKGQTAHNALRILYLVLIGASMPGSLWYLKLHISITADVSPAIFMILIYLAGTVFLTFFIFFSQIHFPERLPAAGLSLLVFLSNACSGFALADFNLFYGAFSVVFCNMLGLSIFFIFLLSMFFRKKSREKIYFNFSEKATLVIFLVLLLMFAGMIRIYAMPLLAEIKAERNVFLKLLYLLFFVSDWMITAKSYIQYNIMLKVHDAPGSKQSAILSDWAIPIIITLIVSMIASIAIAANIAPAK